MRASNLQAVIPGTLSEFLLDVTYCRVQYFYNQNVIVIIGMNANTIINSPHVRGPRSHLHRITELAEHADTGACIFTQRITAPLQSEIRPLAGQSFKLSDKANIRPGPGEKVIVEMCSGGYGAHDVTQIHDINTDQKGN